MVEARFWSEREQQWYYKTFDTVEDLEEYEVDLNETATASRINKGDWKYA